MFPPGGFEEENRNDFTAIVLGAGDSLRMGQPKVSMRVMGQLAWLRIGRTCLGAGAKKVLVMVSSDVYELIVENMPLGAENKRMIEPIVVPEKLRRRGPIGSVLHGIRCAGETGGWLLWPVDHPFVDKATIVELANGSALIRIPRNERRGHPIYIDASDREGLLEVLESGDTLRDYVRARAADIEDIAVSDPAIQWNCDSPAAFRSWHAKFEERVKATDREAWRKGRQ